ncbi:MAG: dephospho-CoA kinase [Alphaproteobacteria bacterium]|jgi:dephospho-CoA kinase|tara:strand:+ start:10239 stop:10829 length:591 start_codon:yes stop_codon:yes gene_type:complete
MIVLGLTGSIGMGKTTVAKLFADLDVPVFNSDEAVNLIYMKNPDVLKFIKDNFIEYENDIICKKRISEIVFNDKKKLAILEKFIHPLVREKQINFINESKKKKKPLIIIEIPLLYEVGVHNFIDFSIVVTAPFEIQKSRVLQRKDMSEKKFLNILDRQMPDREKCAKADYIINNLEIEATKKQVVNLCNKILNSIK